MASRKLRHYFQECSIPVASEVPLNDIINNGNATGRIAKWAIELLPFDITYKQGELSSHRFWPTSSPNGLKPNSLKSTAHTPTGSCTSTLNDIINNGNATGRIAKWAIELLPFDITYKQGELSSHRFWPTSSPNGLKPNSLKSTAHTPTGSCTSTAPKCWLV